MAESYDVAVIGGGPAGCATALSLRLSFPQISVVVLEASDYAGHRVGEILPPTARSLLRCLDVLSALDCEHGIVSRAVASAWGGPRLTENHYIFSAAGGGWHLNRSRFDAMLARQCESHGARVLRGTALRSASRECGGWLLRTDVGKFAATFVVDATGRTAMFARMQGARLKFRDKLTSYTRTLCGVWCECGGDAGRSLGAGLVVYRSSAERTPRGELHDRCRHRPRARLAFRGCMDNIAESNNANSRSGR